MSRFTYEGDFLSATKVQLDFISEVLSERGFKGSKVIMEPVGKPGDNYVASVKRIVVTENGETFKMIAKLAPENENLRKMANVEQIFENEHILYTEVLPKFDQIQKLANIPDVEQIRFAECYGSSNNAPHEVILLEDLREHNFVILDRFEPLSCENVKLVLRNFAIFNAISYAIRYKDPDTYAVFQKLLAANLEYAAWEEEESFYYLNDNVAVQSVLIDFQEAKENSPVYDLMYLLFNSTTHEQRSMHYHQYIEYYHNQLDIALHHFGLNAIFVYPKDRLDADMKLYGKLVFATSVIVATFVTKKNEEVEKMNEVLKLANYENDVKSNEVYKLQDEESIDMFRRKIEGLVDSFVEFGLL